MIERELKIDSKGCLKVLCLNCCGIKTRSNYPEFISLLEGYDIVCLVETKTDNLDQINIPGFKFKMKNRTKIAKKRSGGIVVGYRESLENNIQFIDTDSKYVLWFKCNEHLFKTDEPVYFGVVYIPPEHTRYSSLDSFNELEQEFLSFSSKSRYICLVGDFNSRTSTEPDFVDTEENRHIESNLSEFIDNYSQLLSDLKMPLLRYNMDKTKTDSGICC